MTSTIDVWVTGYGSVTALGHDGAEIWRNMETFADERVGVDSERFAPYPVHVLAGYPVEQEIPRPGDRRAMGPTMLAGVFAAGRALDRAGLKRNDDLLKKTQLIVACHCNDRDDQTDAAVLCSVSESTCAARTLNETLAANIRPTLFLAQLPNILASNISIVFGVTGPSVTLLGEETAGANAVQLAWRRLQRGQADVALVGGAFIGHNECGMMNAAASGDLLAGDFADVWSRDGVCLGGGAAFLVLERAEHARERGSKPIARLTKILNGRSRRRPESSYQTAVQQWKEISEPLNGSGIDVLSSACGKAALASEELKLWSELRDAGKVKSVTGVSSGVGLLRDAAVPVNVAFALSCLERRSPPPALSRNGVESKSDRTRSIDRILSNVWGFTGGEVMVLLEAVHE